MSSSSIMPACRLKSCGLVSMLCSRGGRANAAGTAVKSTPRHCASVLLVREVLLTLAQHAMARLRPPQLLCQSERSERGRRARGTFGCSVVSMRSSRVQVYGLTVLTKIGNSQYIKWNLQISDAPSGTSELQASEAIEWAYSEGAEKVSWGSGAAGASSCASSSIQRTQKRADAIEPGASSTRPDRFFKFTLSQGIDSRSGR